MAAALMMQMIEALGRSALCEYCAVCESSGSQRLDSERLRWISSRILQYCINAEMHLLSQVPIYFLS
jgi:hypothetical protein